MPQGFQPFRKKRQTTGDPFRDVWLAIEHIERWASLAPGTLSVEVDESGGPASVAFPDGTPSSGGGGGGGTSDPGGTHSLLGDTHEDTVAASPVAGDIVIANATPAWTRLAKGSDGNVLTLASGLPSWAAPASSGTGKAPLGAWAKGNISLLTGSDSILKNCWTKATTDEIPQVMPAAGTVAYLSGALDGDVGGVGDSLTLTLYKDTGSGMTATALTLVITGGAGTEQYASPGTGGPISFNAGDRLAVYGKVGGSVGARELSVTIWGTLD